MKLGFLKSNRVKMKFHKIFWEIMEFLECSGVKMEFQKVLGQNYISEKIRG